MKLSTKLKISFGVMILVPVLLCSIGFVGLLNFKLYSMNSQYSLGSQGYGSLINPIQIITATCEEQYLELTDAAASTPERLLDHTYVETVNEELAESGAYLIVMAEQECIYYGEEQGAELVEELLLLEFSEDSDTAVYLSDIQAVVDRISFATASGTEGAVYIVMRVGSLLPQMKRLLVDSIVAIVIALILTSAIFTVWIYRETVKPIDRLRLATRNIKEGNLDFDMDTSGEDEFSELCRDFDAMRLRLKTDQEEKLEADRESRELISNISHDLKTPITSIKGYVEGLMDGVANTPEKQEKYVKIIYNKACEMDTLINELTFYSKIDNGRVPYNFTVFPVVDYFTDCAEEIGMDLENRGFAFGYTCEVSEETQIMADPEQLKRVIHNIVNNSVKYVQRSPGRISIHLKEDENRVYIALSDNGTGIEEKDIPYIFDRFYRSDASRNSKTGGSGIGLSIVKKIVEDHGGTIWCESVVNEGTTMHITLPKYREAIFDKIQEGEQS